MFKNKGFTIIELLIVIAVIAILVGIALPRFRGMQEEGKIAQAKGELRTLQTGLESYYIHNNNTYPAALSSLTSATPNIIGAALPTDPFNGSNNYGYATDGASPVKYYVIYSVGSGGNGSAAVSTAGVVTETNGSSCIYVTNGSSKDTQP
ncbi:MAG: type II secretion system protein [Candidatus Omnitrophica bacterium]|nr:type II secretion system protein [Candidatus Omnitrophota bacterium]